MYDIKLKKTFSKMTEDEKRLMIEQVNWTREISIELIVGF